MKQTYHPGYPRIVYSPIKNGFCWSLKCKYSRISGIRQWSNYLTFRTSEDSMCWLSKGNHPLDFCLMGLFDLEFLVEEAVRSSTQRALATAAQLVGALFHTVEGHRFNSRSRQIPKYPGCGFDSQLCSIWKNGTNWSMFLLISTPFSFSKINKNKNTKMKIY